MNVFDTSLQFKGQWRVYQERVLKNSNLYLKDKKIHIVAAPGSGKTTLGIELMKRLGNPCLILSPSVTIRQQWIERICDAFLAEGLSKSDFISNNIKQPSKITTITYQALHSATVRMGSLESISEEAEDDNEQIEKDNTDYHDFDLYQTMLSCGIKTLCLDEAHHLRNEWWKALEALIEAIPDLTIVSLTATPPYDSTPAEWERYTSLCGAIDEEITAPELVKENSLCPHQDYVYFNMPTKEESDVVTAFLAESNALVQNLLESNEFTNAISSHIGLENPLSHAEQLLEEPKYLSALLIFLNAKGISFSSHLKELLGTNAKLPPLSMKWMEILLQGFLFDNKDCFPDKEEYRERLIQELKAHSLIQKNKVGIVLNESINQMLVSSKGKLESIDRIVESEKNSLADKLRLLILCDFIKKEYVSYIGKEEKQVNEIAVVPVFEMLRRKYQDSLKLGALSGGIVIIPADAVTFMNELLDKKNLKASYQDLNQTGYVRASMIGNNHAMAQIVTEVFNQGYIQVLIGTKSLLGEGWDSPCINSLILASFVGSFMLSNQMRGRAIRSMKGNPDKTSNIWHLVCMKPQSSVEKVSSLFKEEDNTSNDFDTMKRRFQGFMGVHYTKDLIENGLERLSIIKPPFTQKNLESINQTMLTLSKDRASLKERWAKALQTTPKMELVNEEELLTKLLEPTSTFYNALSKTVISLVICALAIGASIALGKKNYMFSLCSLFGIFFAFFYGFHLFAVFTPQKRLRRIGNGIVRALKQNGQISSQNARVTVSPSSDIYVTTSLKNATTREKEVYTTCVDEFFGIVDNQRYLLVSPGKLSGMNKYFCVPEQFSKKKEDAMLFKSCIQKSLGRYHLIFTRNAEGRKVLLQARIHSFANKNECCANNKKRMKSALE